MPYHFWRLIIALCFVAGHVVFAQDETAADGDAAATTVTEPDFIAPDPEAVIPEEDIQLHEKANEAGTVVLRYEYYVDQHKQEIKHGIYEEFYPSGTPMRTATYKHGKPDGMQKWYHNSGALWMEFTTKRGIRDGIYKEYNRNGGLKMTRRYKDGKLLTTRR